MRNTTFNATYTPIFNRLNKMGRQQIEICVYYKGKRKYFRTGIEVDKSEWSEKKKQIKNCKNAELLNMRIRAIIDNMQRYELEENNRGREFSLEKLCNYVRVEKNMSFLDFVEDEINREQTGRATKANERVTLNHLRGYRSNVEFEDISYRYVIGFEKYLYGEGVAVNTINKCMRHLRKFVNEGIKKEYISERQKPFTGYKFKSEETNRVFLTGEEIKKLEGLEVEGERLRYILDLFLFGVYTGLRFSDIVTLQERDIVEDAGRVYLCKKMIKTKRVVKLPLSVLYGGRAIGIIEKYKNEGGQLVFREVTNQYANRALKEIAKVAGIEKRLTFHTSRHTNATDLLSKGVAVTTMQQMLGHSKIDTTMIYAHITNKMIEGDIERAFEKEKNNN